jgi:mRNA-degrading endonuclease toxin of MazEF toxin-antitoxin module
MPRTGRRRSLTIAAAVVTMLAAPAAADAATYSVKAGDGPCGEPADLLCGSLQEAADAAAPGDIFNVAPGPYVSADFDEGGLTINGAPGVTIDGTLTFSGTTGGVSKANKLAISQTTGNAPCVLVSGAAGLELSDSAMVSGNGQGVLISAGTTNKIVRSAIATGGQETAAVRVESTAGTPNKGLRIESSIVIGGKAGIGAYTTATELQLPAGDIAIQANHVTAAGSTHGVELDSSASARLLDPGAGNITMALNDSIAFNNRTAAHDGLLGGDNVATITATRSMLSGDPAAVFVNAAARNFRLKAGSPAINAGGVTAGESATDIEGDDRSTAPTDQGADEYVAPTVVTPPPPPPTPAGTGDGVPPAVVITKPKANQRIPLVTVTTKTKTVTKKGKKVKVKTKTSKRTKIGIAGTAKDASGIKGVVLTIEKISSSASASAAQTTTPAAKCRYFSATKGIVLKSCAKPNLLLATVAKDGTWKFNVKSTIRLGAGRYRVIVVGADNSGAVGNSAPRSDAIRLFTLTKK